VCRPFCHGPRRLSANFSARDNVRFFACAAFAMLHAQNVPDMARADVRFQKKRAQTKKSR
jgi:hypothetical protein